MVSPEFLEDPGNINNLALDPVYKQVARAFRSEYADPAYFETGLLDQGENAIGVILGTGWYNYHALSAWDFHIAPWRAPASLKAQLEITYDDGSAKTVRTNRTWKMNSGPIVFDSIHMFICPSGL